jgi:glycosyltransferase involved in cell wall biosynthesis
MLDAFKEILTEHDNVKLLIIGDGPLREKLETHAKTIGVDSRTIFTGFQVDPQRYLKLMDIFLLPSLSEGTSMTLLEAMSFSKPCVVTDAGGNPEIILDEFNGFVTPNRDMHAFTSGVLKLLNNNALREKMGKNARERYENSFSVENMTNMYQDLYIKVQTKH